MTNESDNSKDPNAPRLALPHIPRPVFLSYARRDFRIAYSIWQQMLSPDEKIEHMDQVLMDFPSVMPPDMKMHGMQFVISSPDHPLSLGGGFSDEWAPGQPGWMFGIGNYLIRAKSLAVVLTPHAAASKAVELEIENFKSFPDKPVFVLRVNGTPIPDSLAVIKDAMVHDVTIDMRSLLGNVLHAAYPALESGDWKNAELLFREAWNLIDYVDDASASLARDILRDWGRALLQLEARDIAVQVFGHILKLTEPEHHVRRANGQYNLGLAHACFQRGEVGRGRLALETAVTCWRDCLASLAKADSSMASEEEIERLRAAAEQAIAQTEVVLKADVPPLIGQFVAEVGQAERLGNWRRVAELYGNMFVLYRAGGQCESAIATDMLAGLARAHRHCGGWEEARNVLRFALKFIDESDRASRAGLLHSLACSYARREPDAPAEQVERKEIVAAGPLWEEALALLRELMEQPDADSRYNYAELARSCEDYVAWAKGELEHRKADDSER